MKIAHVLFRAMAPRHPALVMSLLLLFAESASAQVTINLDNSSQQFFAVDASRNFLYVAEASNAGTKHLSVINTLTNTVVGTYSYSSSNYTSQVAATGTSVYWADQGSSAVRVIAVNGSGVPSLTRSDSATLATGIATLATTYGVSKQGTGDFMEIRNLAGSTLFNVSLGGVAGNMYSDSNTNRYYTSSSSAYKIIDASSGSILGTLSGALMAIDSSSSHNFLYLQNAGTTTRLDQLAGTVTSNTVNTFYDFGAAFNSVAVNSANGDIFVAQTALNRVVQLNSGMGFVQNIAISSPETLAFANGQLFVHGSGQAYLTAIAIPEPSTWAVMLGGLGLGAALWRRRRAACVATTTTALKRG